MLVKARNIGLVVLFITAWVTPPQASCHKVQGALAILAPSVAPDPDSAKEARGDSMALSYLALGDSYTIGESVTIAERYPVQVVKLLKTDQARWLAPEIIATTGWTSANLLDALANPTARTSYDFVSLLIGVNNQFQGRSQTEYSEQFTTLLQRSIRLAVNKPSHVIVLSIPDYSVTPFARSGNRDRIAAEIDSFNVINARIARNYQVHYLDITGESRKAMDDPSLIAADGLHFSGKEYAVWAKMMAPLIEDILK